MFTKSDIGAGSKNDNQAYRQQLIDRGYTFTPYEYDDFRANYADVWDEVQDQMLAGKIVWDSEKGGYWQAPNNMTLDHVLPALLGTIGVGLVFAAFSGWFAKPSNK